MAVLLCTLATEILEDTQPVAVRGQAGRLSSPQRRRIADQLSLAARRLAAISELLLAGSGVEQVTSEHRAEMRPRRKGFGRRRDDGN